MMMTKHDETTLAQQFIECRKRHDKIGMLQVNTRRVNTQYGTSESVTLYDDDSFVVMNMMTGELDARKR